jgi:DNA polymerase/3'-5' exonuclease PolX
MSGTVGTRMERPVAVEIAKRFVALIEDYTDQLIVAGSLRRRLAMIGDIEICAAPKVGPIDSGVIDLFGTHQIVDTDLLDFRMQVLLRDGTVSKRLDANGSPRWGPTLKYLTFEGAHVDLFCPSAERFGWILLLRTGPEPFSRQLVVPKGKRTKDNRPGLMPAYIKPDDGWLTYQTSGERIPTPDEASVFELFSLPYVNPWSRV